MGCSTSLLIKKSKIELYSKHITRGNRFVSFDPDLYWQTGIERLKEAYPIEYLYLQFFTTRQVSVLNTLAFFRNLLKEYEFLNNIPRIKANIEKIKLITGFVYNSPFYTRFFHNIMYFNCPIEGHAAIVFVPSADEPVYYRPAPFLRV